MESIITAKLETDVYSQSTSKFGITFALSHFAFEADVPLQSLIVLGSLYLKSFQRVHIITSDLENLMTANCLRLFDFNKEADPSFTYQHPDIAIKVSCLPEHRVIECLFSDEAPAGGEVLEGSTLVLFDGSAFSTNLFDAISRELDEFILITRTDVADLMEAYQCFKAMLSVNPRLRASFFVLCEEEEEKLHRFLSSEMQGLLSKYHNAHSRFYRLFPTKFLRKENIDEVKSTSCFKSMKFVPLERMESLKPDSHIQVYTKLLSY